MWVLKKKVFEHTSLKAFSTSAFENPEPSIMTKPIVEAASTRASAVA